MKKVSFIKIIILASLLLTCTLPSSIEITGNPSIRFSAKMDFSKIFSDNIREGFSGDKYSVLECTKTKNQTFIIRINLFNEQIGSSLADLGSLADLLDNITTLSDRQLYADSINFSNTDITLEGFKFDKVYSNIFVSGSDIVKELMIKITIDGDTHIIEKPFDFSPSGFNEEEWKEFTALPNRGEPVDLTNPINGGNNIDIDFEVTLPAGRTFPTAWIQDAEVQAELVVWLSLELVAKNECVHEGADLDLFGFMGDFEGDFFGRESADGPASITSYFETMSFIIEFSHDVFKGAILYIESDKGVIPLSFSRKVTDNRLEIVFDEKTMKKINDPDYFPFVPNYRIHFDTGDFLSIPPNFHTNYIILEAKLNTIINLSGNDN